MRLFIAVMLPDDAAKELYGFADALKKKGVTGRIVREQDLHITLAFIGEYGDSNDVIDALSDIDLRPMTIHINDWILDKRSILKAVPLKNEALEELASDIRKALNTARIYYDRKPFSPHVTLMRRTGGIDDLKKTEGR